MNDQAPTITRTYEGKDGLEQFRQDAAVMASNRYTIVSQITEPGGRSFAASVFIVVGVLLLVGGLLFIPLWLVAVVCLVIGLVSGKTGDKTTVIWRMDAQPAPAPAAPAPEQDHLATLGSLAQLRDSGAISSEEYEAKKAELLGRI